MIGAIQGVKKPSVEFVNLGKVGSTGDVTKSVPAPYNDASKYFILSVYFEYDDGTKILFDDQTGWTRCFVNAGNASVFIRTTSANFSNLNVMIAVMRLKQGEGR